MNREIKFRIWDKLLREMHYIDLCDLAEGDDYWYDGETSVWEVMNDATSEQRRYVIQQYTGLKDKNGKEIYEGDMVMFDYEWTKPTEIGVVTWNNENASFQIKGHIPSSSMKHLDRMKVIGNIYEREKENVSSTN